MPPATIELHLSAAAWPPSSPMSRYPFGYAHPMAGCCPGRPDRSGRSPVAPPDRHLLAAIPLLCWLLGVALYSLLRPLSLFQTARQLDSELGLKDRLATALELEVWRGGRLED
ncbi:MAG: hypothetical protein U0401_06100 [Anaerolineae bacterium]